MLRITDARTGEPVDATPTRRGLTRVVAHAPGHDTTALRVLLVADLLVRALELGGTPVWALLAGRREREELRAAAAALGVRPFEDGPETGPGPGGARVIHVAAEDGPVPDGVRVAVAAATADAPGGDTPATADDPSVLRLALLSRRRTAPARLDAAALTDARDTLARWRGAVAAWARRPSRPVPDEVRGRLRAAWEDDLDLPAVLEVLTRVENDPGLPDGARFETYAYADRLLGLDLTRDLGSPA
ncbi:hypothetical protein [Streptomyces sp. H51]|uniref:hypothetical protein n=1 Tax=Streptomyces sp. H51 TaxID=3111770 RepID=UPI002D786152|nr:hypothetical protein [Streptomyces sp. H51]